MTYPTVPSDYPDLAVDLLGRGKRIRATDVKAAVESAHYCFAKLVATLGGYTRGVEVTISSSTYVQICGTFKFEPSDHVAHAILCSEAEDGWIKLTITDGTTSRYYEHEHAAGADTNTLETEIFVNAEVEYTCTIEAKKGAGDLALFAAALYEAELTRAEL